MLNYVIQDFSVTEKFMCSVVEYYRQTAYKDTTKMSKRGFMMLII